jgi:hypothetical protein
VRERLRPVGAAPPSADELAGLLATPLGIDGLESFLDKFSRMQDTINDKLLPAVLRAAGEPVGSAIDRLMSHATIADYGKSLSMSCASAFLRRASSARQRRVSSSLGGTPCASALRSRLSAS